MINIVTVIYLPWVYYLLYKRRRWGWILVFAGVLIEILGLPMQIYSYTIYLRAMRVEQIDGSSLAWFVIQTIIKIVFAWFLWRQDICDLFRVDKSIRKRTVLYTSLITFLVFGALWYFY